MLRAHVAAGLDPAAFWQLTPREWLMRMQGVEDRLERERVQGALNAWMGTHADQKSLLAWLSSRPAKPREPLAPEAIERMLKHTVAGLPEMTMKEFLDKQKGRK